MWNSVPIFLTIFLISLTNAQNLSALTSKAQLLSPRSATASVFDGVDTIYIFGGWYYDPELELIPYADIHAYNISSDTIQVIAQLPRTSWNGIIHFDKDTGDIYLLRGDGTFLWRFVPSTGVTHAVAEWFGNSGSITGAFTAGKKIVTFGGLEGSSQVYEFDFTSQTQGPVGVLPLPSELSVGIHVPKLNSTFLFAGELGNWNPVLMRYDHLTNFTTVLTNVTFPSWRHGDGVLVSVNGRNHNNTELFLIGAGVENGTRGNGFIQYTPNTSEVIFTPVQGLPEGLTDVSAVYVERLNRIYIFGGYDLTNTDRAEIWFVDLK